MRLAGKILLVLSGATAAAVVAPIGCGVDSNRFPGIGNEVPATPYGDAGTGPASDASSSGTTSGGINACQCAATVLAPDGGACGECARDTVLAGGDCKTLQSNCDVDTNCQSAFGCAATCAMNPDPGPCMEACVVLSPLFASLMDCECATLACKTKCSVKSPIACSLGTGGAGGMGTGGNTGSTTSSTGSGGSGGAGGGP